MQPQSAGGAHWVARDLNQDLIIIGKSLELAQRVEAPFQVVNNAGKAMEKIICLRANT